MPEEIPAQIPNKILAALPVEEYGRLLPQLEQLPLAHGTILYEADDQINDVYFPNTGIVSLVTHLQEGASVEVGLTGREGMVGISVVLGDSIAPNQAIVQISGGAMRLAADALREEISRGGRLQSLLLRYVQILLRQTSQTAACNRTHHVGGRLARWLLTCHDRVESDELPLTQEFIAEMLGTRRSGVSEAAVILQAMGLIRYVRGHITVLDREGLEEYACECYGVVKKDFDRLTAN